jgi:hypothetical protein
VRAIKTITISILALGLLAGSAVGVAAKDEEAADPMAPSTFAWDYGDEETEQGFFIEAVDPRASGEMSLGELSSINTDANGIGSWESRLANDGGAWVGIGKEIGGSTQDRTGGDWQADEFDSYWEVGITMWEMTGEGGYDGLSLILFEDAAFGPEHWRPYPFSWGIIFPSELPAGE